MVSITNNHCLDKEHVIREIRSILDDFLHLLHHHDTPMDFEYIHSLLTNHRCSITTCSIFRRHYRRRSSNVSHEHDITVMRILDRIHCFYQPYSSSHSNHDYIRYVRNRYSSLKEEICIGME
eukprot:167980_1